MAAAGAAAFTSRVGVSSVYHQPFSLEDTCALDNLICPCSLEDGHGLD
jgi:hypothetical protein